MRRGFRRQRVPKVNVPKIKKPKTSDLKKALEGYVSASESERLNALALAAMWYWDGKGDGAVAYVLANKLTPTSLGQDKLRKLIDRADNCRKRAAGTTFAAERDTSLRMAIHQYEKVCEQLSVPKLADFVQQYEAKKKILDQKVQDLQAKYGNTIESIGKALGLPLEIWYCDECKDYKPKSSLNGCETKHPDKLSKIEPMIKKLEVTDSNKTPKGINLQEGSLQYAKTLAKLMGQNIRREGILPVVLRELPDVVKYSSVEKNAEGHWISNRDKHIAFQLEALNNLTIWMKSAESPNRLVRKFSIAVTAPAGQTSHAPKAHQPRPVGARVRGKAEFTPGTKRHALYEALTDGQWHSTSDLKSAVPGISLKTELHWVDERGQRYGKWKVENQGNQYRLVQTGGTN